MRAYSAGNSVRPKGDRAAPAPPAHVRGERDVRPHLVPSRAYPERPGAAVAADEDRHRRA